MINYKYGDLFLKDSTDKQMTIQTDDGLVNITNVELHNQQFELSESLCSESELRFGSCESSTIKFKISNIFIPLKDKWITVKIVLNGQTDDPFIIGRYKVYSDVPTADRRFRDVTAYDAMYDIINANVADWYNQILPNKDSKITMRDFRKNFISHFGLQQEEAELVNDDMIVEKTIEPSEISGKDVISSICEINGCFGHITRNGKFRYISLDKNIQGLYPANDLFPADDLYPKDSRTNKIGNSFYISCKYEDFETQQISKLQIRQEENDIGSIVGTGTNCYIVEDNFLVYGKSAGDLEKIAGNLYGAITGISYRPFEADCKGNPCLEVGDAVRLTTKYEIIETYILKRTLKGIQALRDVFSSEGIYEYSEKVNSVNKSIIQLKGKTNVLERTVEETKSTITDVEKGLQSQITQNAEEIKLEVSRAQEKEGELSASIKINADKITAEVKRATETDGELSTKITQTAEEIRSEVKNTENGLQSQITQNAEGISTKVSKSSVVSEINQSAEGIKIKAELLELLGNVSMTGGYVHINSDETVGNIIELKRPGTLVQMGNDGVRASSGTRVSTFQYSNITIQNGDMVAKLTDEGKGISSYGWESYSDSRLKHGISALDIDKCAEFIYAQKPCRFIYNYDKDGLYRHGLIAQEVRKSVGDEKWAVVGENKNLTGETYLSINYIELIADLIATAQSQNKRIDELKERVRVLEENHE